MTFVECLGHGSQDLHVHIWTDSKRRRLGVWNIARQQPERGLELTRRVRECLEGFGFLGDEEPNE